MFSSQRSVILEYFLHEISNTFYDQRTIFTSSQLFLGGEEGRTSGWSGTDPSRRRVSAPAINAASLPKQKSPVGNDSSGPKDAMVSWFLLHFFTY